MYNTCCNKNGYINLLVSVSLTLRNRVRAHNTRIEGGRAINNPMIPTIASTDRNIAAMN